MDYHSLLSEAARYRLENSGSSVPQVPYSFEAGMPDPSTYPLEGLARSTERALKRDPLALNYGHRMGFEGMRDIVIALERSHGGRIPIRENVMITSGANQALHHIYGALISPGDTILLEEHSYVAQQVKMYYPNVETITMDIDGPNVEDLEAKLISLREKEIRPKFFYMVTGFHNPLGTTLTLQRSKRIIQLAKEYDLILVEDDPYSHIRFEGIATPSLYSLDDDGSHVLRVGTLSKILGAGMRIGWVIGPKKILQALQKFKHDSGTNPFAQRAAADFLEGHLWEHIDVVTKSYKTKRNAMLHALSQYCVDLCQWNTPAGGIFIWLQLQGMIDDELLARTSENFGVAYRAGSAFSSNGGGRGFLRFAYSFQDTKIIHEGIERFSNALRSVKQSNMVLGSEGYQVIGTR
jgi:2-aminoadipate transaminase